MDPDPGGPKPCGSGSPTLGVSLLIRRLELILIANHTTCCAQVQELTGLDPSHINITDAGLNTLIKSYCRYTNKFFDKHLKGQQNIFLAILLFDDFFFVLTNRW
jgi:hypothetical protein